LSFVESWFPIFQMRVEQDADRQGWVLSDEGDVSNEFATPAFTIALPFGSGFGTSLPDGSKYGFPVEIEGRPRVLVAKVTGAGSLTFQYGGLTVRWAYGEWTTHRVMQNIYSYIGREASTLAFYGKIDGYVFGSLAPLDLMTMDRLYLQHRVVFVGVTKSFGPHVKSLSFSEAS
jgi:hypothetical protein